MDEAGSYRIELVSKARVVETLEREGFTRRQVIKEATALHESGRCDIATVYNRRRGEWRDVYSAGNISRP